MTRQAITPAVLRQLLRYEPESGKLFWLNRSPEFFAEGRQTAARSAAVWNGRYAGKEALTARHDAGYRVGSVFDVAVFANRAAWAIMTGEWPASFVDHINGNPEDNRWSNLRLATNAENLRNRGKQKNNTSGFKGVTWCKTKRRWIAQIKLMQKTKNLGSFKDAAEAHEAYAAAATLIHREYARAE